MNNQSEPAPHEPHDVRPVVPRGGSSNAGAWVFAIVLILGGWLIFSMLSDRRAALTAPRTAAISGPVDEGLISSPPPLALPGSANPYYYSDPRYPVLERPIPGPAPIVQTVPAARTAAGARVSPPQAPAPIHYPPEPARAIPLAQVTEALRALPEPSTPATDAHNERIKAGRLANPAMTVPLGTVIPAVLETALDSTRPGAARALVQRNVYGFDGTRVLIPRGSRLYGEYEANLEAGQKRAAIRWTRLLRPDGVTVALDSPASDPLGRAGIKGKVDSKFLQRFGGALLQSVLDVGVGIAASRATDGVIVALPGSTQNVHAANPQQIKPTLTVRPGTSVSVFVARDLDFAGVDG
jgi:type IV secretion system protein VirB10